MCWAQMVYCHLSTVNIKLLSGDSFKSNHKVNEGLRLYITVNSYRPIA